MESSSGPRAIVPFRHRHDGWTPRRQAMFLERLEGTGSVTEACRAVGLSTTSAYRAFHRMPDFAMHWSRALEARRPMLEDAAFERAVHGSLQPLTRLGKVIGQRRCYSDSLLRFLIERDDRRAAATKGDRAQGGGARSRQGPPVATATAAETNAALLKRLRIVEGAARDRERAEMLAWAERMEQAGWAP